MTQHPSRTLQTSDPDQMGGGTKPADKGSPREGSQAPAQQASAQNPMTRVQPKREDILPHLERMSRQPFQEVLSVFLAEQPSAEAIKSMAEQNPDKWATSLKTTASLAGYADKTEVQNNFYMDLRSMGDAELLQKLQEFEKEMLVIDGHAEIVPTDSAHDFNETNKKEVVPSPEPGTTE